jgi:hypothetical protein
MYQPPVLSDPHNRSPLRSAASYSFQHSKLNSFAKKLSKSQLFDHLRSSPEKAGIYSLTETKASLSPTAAEVSVDTLEAELLANVKECTGSEPPRPETRIPVSLSALDLGCKQEHGLDWRQQLLSAEAGSVGSGEEEE